MSVEKTIFEYCQYGQDVNKALLVVHYAKSNADAVEYLENNGGGVYRNTLHGLQYEVKSKTK